MRDIETKEKNNVIDDKTEFIYNTKKQWKGSLAVVIADNFGCCVYANREEEYVKKNNKYVLEKNRRICFIGKEEDVNMCKIIYEYALNTVMNRIKEKQKELRQCGESTRGVDKNYGIGFSCGLKANFEEQIKANAQWGLIVVKDKEVMEFFNNKDLGK